MSESSDNEEVKGGDYQNFGGDEAYNEKQQEEEDPYKNDEQTYQEHFRKTFITENQKKMTQNETKQTWTLHDMIIPAGKTAKLVRIKNPKDQDFRVTEICDKLKFVKQTPVIILAGAMTQRAGKALAGICRAAFRTDAFVIDSGVGSGIEKFCLRKNVTLIGVSPESEVTYPRINPTQRRDNELTNGHSHFFLIGDENKKFEWGEESKLKFELAQRIANGRSKFGGSKYGCKIVTVLLGDNPFCFADIEQSLNLGIPVVVLEGSDMANEVFQLKEEYDNSGDDTEYNTNNASKQEVMRRLAATKFIRCRESSEDLASIVHLLLAVTLF